MTECPMKRYPFESSALDLPPEYAELRREGPLAKVSVPYGPDVWLATRYADVKMVLSDPRFSRTMGTGENAPRVTTAVLVPGSLLDMDPPEHTRHRKLVTNAFTVRRVEGLRGWIQDLVDGMLDDIERQGPPVDLVKTLAEPLPVTVICQMLGVPLEDQANFHLWTGTILTMDTDVTPEQISQSYVEMKEYLADLISRRRANPTDDLLGALVRELDQDDELNEHDLVMLGIQLLIAGHHTTLNHIGNFVYSLLTRKEWARLAAEPELVPRAVEELLRFVPIGPSEAFARIASEDIQVGEVLVRKGEGVYADTMSANRDDLVFHEPDELDLSREQNPHVAFGHGIHRCLGAPLARVELQVTIGALARRFPNLRLAIPQEEVSWQKGVIVRGTHALPVAW